MSRVKKEDVNVIMRDVHCPFCETDEAILMNRTTSKKVSIQLPAYGLKFILSVLYLSILHIWKNGYKLIEATKQITHVTYAFCPKCGNSYSLNPPEEIKEEEQPEYIYKISEGKVITGLCKGISDYTGISLLWIRIMTVLYAFTIIGGILYLVVSLCSKYKETDEDDETTVEN